MHGKNNMTIIYSTLAVQSFNPNDQLDACGGEGYL